MVSRFPVATWTLTGMGFATVAWLVADYRALDRTALTVRDGIVELSVGRRVRGRVEPSRLAAVTRATWRDIPAPGSPGFINATKPAEPNVLIAFAGEVPLTVVGATRRCRVLGLHLDEPADAVTTLAALAGLGAAGEQSPEPAPQAVA